ncbi:MAG: winged helix-turn-helix domain-containing protein [Candidatus Bathyarchaeia archaeon]
MVNRDRHEIAIEIMNRAVSGKKKTELMRDVGLSYLQAKLYLGELVDRGLLQIDERQNFKTTKKGLEFMEKCEACPLFGWDKEKLKTLL